MKRLLITGAAGFLGQRLARKLLDPGKPGFGNQLEKLVLLDSAAPRGLPDDPRVDILVGDIGDADLLRAAVTPELDGVIHLAAVVSAAAEAHFELGMRVNLDGTRGLLEACRRAGTAPRFLFSSSLAVYGGDLPEVVSDTTSAAPDFSYGVQKRLCELLVTEYHRRGYLDGRAVRLPTVVIRPGVANKAASSFASSILREPLSGAPAICPVTRNTPLWILSPRRAIEALWLALNIDSEALGPNRVLNLPGLTVTVEEMLSALRHRIGARAEDLVAWRPDPAVARIIASWPSRFCTARAHALGFRGDASIDDIIENFVIDDLPQQKILRQSPPEGACGQ